MGDAVFSEKCYDDEDEEFTVYYFELLSVLGGNSRKTATTHPPVKLTDLLPVFTTRYLPIRKH
jgi:hypothetical protein